MTNTNVRIKGHPTEAELASYLDNSLKPHERRLCEEHLSSCEECLTRIVSAYEAVRAFKKDGPKDKRGSIMKKINLYLVLAIITFTLSFLSPRYFLQLLLATLLLGAKWIADSRSTKMLLMIYDAWKSGGDKEASRVIRELNTHSKGRF